MYPDPHFKAKSNDEIFDFIRSHPLATLVGNGSNGLVATHVPLTLKRNGERLFLEGHMMRKTDHHVAFERNPGVLAIFNGPNCYVSASWYDDPMSGSTWNYMTVHARGNVEFLDNDNLRRILDETTTRFENNANSPAAFDKLTDQYVSGMMKAIAAFRIEVTSLENVFKLSQNRNDASYQNIVEQLKKRSGENALVADEMEKHRTR